MPNNFYKGFNCCSILLDNFFKKTLNITNDIHPYTDIYMIFSYNKKHNYKDVEIVWNLIIHFVEDGFETIKQLNNGIRFVISENPFIDGIMSL